MRFILATLLLWLQFFAIGKPLSLRTDYNAEYRNSYSIMLKMNKWVKLFF